MLFVTLFFYNKPSNANSSNKVENLQYNAAPAVAITGANRGSSKKKRLRKPFFFETVWRSHQIIFTIIL